DFYLTAERHLRREAEATLQLPRHPRAKAQAEGRPDGDARERIQARESEAIIVRDHRRTERRAAQAKAQLRRRSKTEVQTERRTHHHEGAVLREVQDLAVHSALERRGLKRVAGAEQVQLAFESHAGL